MGKQFKTTRRSFLKLSGSALGGVVAATYGCRSLNLSGLKSKKEEQDREQWKHTACAMCLMCPMQAKVKNGKIVDVKGEDILPWKGNVCAKAYAGIWGRVYAPDRILHPLKRVGKRGDAKFVRCSWDEVTSALAKTVKRYSDAGHPEWFEIWWGCPVQTDNMYFLHYWSRVTGANISYMHGQICFGDHAAEKNISFGKHHAGAMMMGAADYTNCKYALIAGQNYPGNSFTPGTAMGASAFYPLYLKAKENGMKVTVVDPKLADSSAMADEWVPLKPATDAIFVLGIANVLIKENLIDEDFLLKYTNAPQLIRVDNGQAMKDTAGRYLAWHEPSGTAKPMGRADHASKGFALGLGRTFEVNGVTCKTAFQLYAEEAAPYTPEKVVRECGIPYSGRKIVEIARRLGNNKPSVVVYPGLTTGRYANWFQVLRAYSTINMLLGNMDGKGGHYFPKHGFKGGTGWPEPPEVPPLPRPGLKTVPAAWGNQVSIEALDKKPCYTTPKEFHPATVALPWEHFDAMKEGRIKALFSTAENSAITQVDTSLVYECLHKLELIVVGEQLPKEFVELADYVIPEASYVERNHLYSFTPVAQDGKEHAMAFMRSAAIPPQGDSKPVSWFMTEVGKKMGLGPYFENLDHEYEWWDRILKKAKVPATARQLVENGPYVKTYPMTYNVLYKSIETRSGRFELYSNELSEECCHNPASKWYNNIYVNPLPIYIPIATPKKADEFYMVCGKASWHQKNATQNNRYLMEDDIEGGNPYTPLYMNPERAKKLGLKEGDLLEIECIGPTKAEEPCVVDEAALGYKQNIRLHISEGLHPDAAWTFFAAGHNSKLMLPKNRDGVLHSAFIPLSVEPYAGGCGKNYSIIKVRKIGG